MEHVPGGPGHGPGDRPSAAQTRASPGSSLGALGPQTRRLRPASGGSWQHTPEPRLGPNAAQTACTGVGDHVVLGWVPPAHPEPSPAFQSTPGGLLPGARGNLARTCRPGFFWPARPPRRHRVGAGRSWLNFGKKLDGSRDPRSKPLWQVGGGLLRLSFKRASGVRPLFSAGGPGKAQPAACPAPCIHPGCSGDKPSSSSFRSRSPTN